MPIIRIIISVLFLTVAIAASAGRYYDLAVKAYQSGDYERCIELYKKVDAEAKAERKQNIISWPSWWPYIESAIALNDYRKAFHGITDNHRIINKKYWVNGREWKLSPEILEAWPMDMEPMLDVLFDKLIWEYADDNDRFRNSPFVNHIARKRHVRVDSLESVAARSFMDSANECLRQGYAEYSVNHLLRAARFGHEVAIGIAAGGFERGGIPLSGSDTIPLARDYTQALEFHLMKVRRYPQQAQYNLVKCGEYYAEGNGVERDLHKAIQYYRRALECDTTVNMLSNAAYKQIANCYGELGDTAMFFNISREAVDRGYTWSLHNLGNCYKNGEGTPKDLKKAFETYSLGLNAKDGGSTSEACGYEVGVALLNGNGCERDSIKGIEMIKEHIHVFPQVTNFILADANYKQARWSDAMKYCLAVAEGDSGFPKAALSRVCRWIAAMYTHGRGVTADEYEAQKWWKKAEEYGDDDAEIIRKLLGY